MFTYKDRLHVQGMDIVNADGRKVTLRGTNFGGWLMREGWMDGGSACRMPLHADVVIKDENSMTLDLGKKRPWNRMECHTKSLAGEFLIEISDNGNSWEKVCEDCFENRRRPTVEENAPTPYKLYENPHDDGCFFCDGTIHVNETRSRYIRLTAKNLPERVSVGYFGDIDDFTSRQVLKDRFGEEKAADIIRAYQDAYIQQWDLDYIKSLGMNFVRIPIYWQVIMTPEGKIKADAWDKLDWLIESCNAMELYVMLDFHGAPGAQTGGSLTCGQIGSNELWNNPVYQEMSADIVAAIARRYAKEPCVCMIDVLNEPLPVYNDQIPSDPSKKLDVITQDYVDKLEGILKKLYDAVRKESEELIISINLFYEYHHTLKAPKAYGWENVIYQTHTYGIDDWRNEDAMIRVILDELADLSVLKEKWQVPVLSGESNFWGHEKAWKTWLTGLHERDIHWATWTYKNIDPTKRDSWGLLYSFQGVMPDYYRDSEKELLEKLKAFESSSYLINQEFVDILKDMILL